MTTDPTSKLAFVGLGIMGGHMAGRLLDAGHALTLYTRTRSKADHLLARGAAWADTPAAAAADADVVFICVTDTPDVEAVLFGDNGIVSANRAELIVVDHSTISPIVTRTFAERLQPHHITLLDAPVSGGDAGARSGTLSIMVGGDRVAFDRVTPLLQLMGKTITHCGRSGDGQATKAVNQVLVSLTNLAVCEALTLATAIGLDPKALLAAVSAGAAGSWQLSNLGPKMIDQDFRPGFMVDLQAKDLRLVREAADAAGLNLTASRWVAELFELLRVEGAGREGTQALIKAVAEQARRPLATS